MTLIFDLVGQGQILLTIFDDVEIHVKNQLPPMRFDEFYKIKFYLSVYC